MNWIKKLLKYAVLGCACISSGWVRGLPLPVTTTSRHYDTSTTISSTQHISRQSESSTLSSESPATTSIQTLLDYAQTTPRSRTTIFFTSGKATGGLNESKEESTSLSSSMLSSSGASVTARLETDPPPAKSTTRLAHALQLNQRKNDEGKYELLKILSQEWYQQSQAAFQYQCTNRHVEQFLGDHPCIDLAEAVITDPNSPVHLPVVINHDASDMEEVSAMTELLDYKVRFGFALDNATHLEERAICRPYHIAGHPCDQHIICADNDHQQEDISQYCQLQQHLSTVHNKFTNVRRFQRIQMEDDSMPVNENLDQDIHPPEGDLVTGDMTLHLYTLGMTYQMMKQAEATISIYDVFN